VTSRARRSVPSAGRLPLDEQLAQFQAVLRRNPALTEVLARASRLDLPGWYLVAGCLYQTVWNVVSGQPPAAGILDYALAYFDGSDLSWEAEDAVIQAGRQVFAGLPAPVQIRNQARVHLWYEQKFGTPCPPHESVEAAIDTFEATTACPGRPPSPYRSSPDRRSGTLPRGLLAHLGVVLGQVALHPVDVFVREIRSAARALHDLARGHDPARHGPDLPVDDVGDDQLVAGEVVLVAAVVPDVGVAVLLVRLLLGAGPPADPLLGGGAVPLAVVVGERIVLERGDGHCGRFPSFLSASRAPYPLTRRLHEVPAPMTVVLVRWRRLARFPGPMSVLVALFRFGRGPGGDAAPPPDAPAWLAEPFGEALADGLGDTERVALALGTGLCDAELAPLLRAGQQPGARPRAPPHEEPFRDHEL